MVKERKRGQSFTERSKCDDENELKMLLSSQELTPLDSICSLKSSPSFSTGTEFKQVNNWLHTCQSFHLLPDQNEQNMGMVQDDQFGVVTNPPFSPQKRYCEVTEGVRHIANLKPIILCGKNNEALL